MQTDLTVSGARLGRFVLSGYRGFVNNTFSGRQHTLSKLNTIRPASLHIAKLVICDRESMHEPQLEFQSGVCIAAPLFLGKVSPKLQDRKIWNELVLPKLLSAIQNSNCISHEDLMQLRQIVLKEKTYSNTALQAAIIVGNFYSTAMQVTKPPKSKELKLAEGFLSKDDENINLRLYVKKSGGLEVRAKSSKENTHTVVKTIMPFLPTSYIESKHLFSLACLDAIDSFKLLAPDEELEFQQIVLGDKPFSRTALQLSIFLNEAYEAFSNLPIRTIFDIRRESRIHGLRETMVKDSQENTTNLNCLVSSEGLLELRASPVNSEEASFHVDIIPDWPQWKSPINKGFVLGSIIDALENVDEFERVAEPLREFLGV